MNFVTLIGTTAAVLGIFTFLPQVIQCYKTKNTTSISYASYVIILINTILWSTYGYFRQDLPVVGVNVFIFFCSLAILIMKRKYG